MTQRRWTALSLPLQDTVSSDVKSVFAAAELTQLLSVLSIIPEHTAVEPVGESKPGGAHGCCFPQKLAADPGLYEAIEPVWRSFGVEVCDGPASASTWANWRIQL